MAWPPLGSSFSPRARLEFRENILWSELAKKLFPHTMRSFLSRGGSNKILGLSIITPPFLHYGRRTCHFTIHISPINPSIIANSPGGGLAQTTTGGSFVDSIRTRPRRSAGAVVHRVTSQIIWSQFSPAQAVN
jgi:hypothetical protein